MIWGNTDYKRGVVVFQPEKLKHFNKSIDNNDAFNSIQGNKIDFNLFI